MASTFTPMHTVLKPGALGDARLETFSISEEDSKRTAMRAVVTRRPDELIRAGTYCRLYVKNELMMSDTDMEQRSNTGVVLQARGDVLIAGLGIGMILVPILAKKEVQSVTVVEKFDSVIDLVKPQLQGIPGAEKLNVVHADIFTWQPPKGQKWDVIYFDIWPEISEENLAEMATLHQKYKGRKKPKAWMQSWQRDRLKARREQSQRQERYFGGVRW